MIEYWSGNKGDFEFPTNIDWQYKTDTDLYEFVKVKSYLIYYLFELNYLS